MKVQGEQTINISGKEYWLVSQFAKLTQRSQATVRTLITKGNRIRKLQAIHCGGKPFIEAEELFNFPFVTNGRPAWMGDYVEKFYLGENNQLLRSEEIHKKECL